MTIADLIGEVDMIKHAEGRYLSSELTMHFGLIPRTNRGIFCINELPDLAPKIQVGLFNVLEERDVQIRGYPVRLDLDLCMVFSANPEDYTNRGRIVTPLKDRIGSVIRTHYPLTREIGIAISDQNAWLDRERRRCASAWRSRIFIKEIVEEIARLARSSPHVNQQSGVSVRMSIANLENVVSNAERRAISPSRALDRAPRLGPGGRGRQRSRQARADDVRGRRARRQADPSDHRRGGQEHLHASLRRPRAAADRRLLRVGPQRRGRRHAAEQRCARADRQGPGPAETRRGARRASCCPNSSDREAREAAAASAAEFILEGLHVHNKLNKSAKNGRRCSDRYQPLNPSYREPVASHAAYLNTPSGTARSSSCRSRPTRSSTSSPNI